MNLIYVSLKILPMTDHPRYYEIGGAFFSAFLPDESNESIVARVTELLRLLRWSVAEVRDICSTPIGTVLAPQAKNLPDDHLPLRNPPSLPGFEIPSEAFFFGISYRIAFYAPGEETALRDLQPPSLEDS